MIGYEWIGFGLVVSVVMAAGGLTLVSSRLSSRAKLWILCGLGCIVAGSLLRYFIYETFYGGQKDAGSYFEFGLMYARHFTDFDFSILSDTSVRRYGAGTAWHGTNFIDWVSGFVLVFTGPTRRGEYLAFALLAFAGRLCIWRSAVRTGLPIRQNRFLFWLAMWPSLWWWTSVAGKDSLILFGIGLAILGYAGRQNRIQWTLIIPGVAVVFCIRPEVAAVIAMTFILAYWLSFEGEWTAKKAVQGVVMFAAGGAVVFVSMQSVGVGSVQGAQAYAATNAQNVSTGGSAVGSVGVSWYAAPLGLINVLFRPFPWEANNPFVLASGLEMYLLWGMLLYRWKSVKHAVLNWRSSRMLRFALPFVLVYSALLGMALGNLSIISRQRIFIFPFIFLLFCWKRPEEYKMSESEARRHRRVAA